jgi:uncharacterized protein YdeI (YjbR/CyaY-like superfamily)
MDRHEPRRDTTAARGFRDAEAFRAWLKKNHAKAIELVVRLRRVHAAHRGITYAEALDEALCYGWIDGVRRPVDADSFSVRFTPRKKRSTWSLVNVRHAKRLIADGRMMPPGLAAFEARVEEQAGTDAFERQVSELAPSYLQSFQSNRKAWEYFQSRPPWYRRTTVRWVMSARKEETRAKRVAILIECSARATPIPALGGEKLQSPRPDS